MEISLPYNYRPRPYQLPVWSHFVPDPFQKSGVVLAHRRWGKDLLCLNIAVTLSQVRVGTYWHVLPFANQSRAVVWNNKDKKGRKFLDYIPNEIISHKHENEMRVHFKNGSIYQCIGGDDIDRHVGTNPIGVILSEWSIMDPRVDDYISPILLENDGWCLKIFTVRGKNRAWKDLKHAEVLQRNNPRWIAINQTVADTYDDNGERVISDEKIERERVEKGRSEQFIRQEYYNDPEIPIEGTYYLNELMKARADGRICSVPYDPKLPVDTFWDIGFSDFTVIIFAQTFGREKRIIDVYCNSGEEVGHYASVMNKLDYNYGRHYGPWDLEIKQLAAGGKSVFDVAKSHGIKFIVTPQPRHVTDGIEQVRNMFPMLWIDEKKCARLLEAAAAYRKEPLADNLQLTGSTDDFGRPLIAYKDKPLHDWTSHYMDALRIMAWHEKKKPDPNAKLQERAEDNFVYV